MDIPNYVKEQFASLSTLERQSLYQLMGNVAIVDGQFAEQEMAVIKEICQAMNLTRNEIAASRSLSLEEKTVILKNMTEEKRFLVARTISTIAKADGVVTKSEDGFAAYLADILNLKREWF